MSDVNLAQPPGGGPKPPSGIGLSKSPIGGPSGPGASPMVSPGTGAGMAARGKARLKGIIDQLMEIGATFRGDLEAFNEVSAAVRALGRVLAKKPEGEAPKAPIPVPATPPGAGLGGLPGGPPTGLPGGGGGAGPIAPGG